MYAPSYACPPCPRACPALPPPLKEISRAAHDAAKRYCDDDVCLMLTMSGSLTRMVQSPINTQNDRVYAAASKKSSVRCKSSTGQGPQALQQKRDGVRCCIQSRQDISSFCREKNQGRCIQRNSAATMSSLRNSSEDRRSFCVSAGRKCIIKRTFNENDSLKSVY